MQNEEYEDENQWRNIIKNLILVDKTIIKCSREKLEILWVY